MLVKWPWTVVHSMALSAERLSAAAGHASCCAPVGSQKQRLRDPFARNPRARSLKVHPRNMETPGIRFLRTLITLPFKPCIRTAFEVLMYSSHITSTLQAHIPNSNKRGTGVYGSMLASGPCFPESPTWPHERIYLKVYRDPPIWFEVNSLIKPYWSLRVRTLENKAGLVELRRNICPQGAGPRRGSWRSSGRRFRAALGLWSNLGAC